MKWLNYHHLLYFWTIAREGSVSAASRKLRLAQPTLSGQLKALEDALEVQLFHRRGGKLVLTDTGAHVMRYADEIFSLGSELQDSLEGLPTRRHPRLVVGAADEVPKLIVQRLLQPALELASELRLVCYEDRQDRLLADLAVHTIDAVIAEAPVESGSPIRAYSHLLGECGVTFFAAPATARRLRRRFPQSLEGEPLLVPIESTFMRRAIERWLEERSIRARIRGEFQDYALLGAFGRAGVGVFAAPSVIEDEIREQYGVQRVGELEDVRQRFYVITVDRRIKHPAVLAITERARDELFAR
ncbi:transcriptional activator NhaR [Sandaracinus amylolyticus]|nr:transcriptional activator NhaR [Sandaracinus amylolyticus]